MSPPQDLLHDALRRATSRSRTATSPPALDSLKLEEDSLIDVATPAPSSPASSVASTPAGSRSSSPSRAGRKSGGAGKPRRDKTKEKQKAEANKNPLDPINRFPGEVNGRIFGELMAPDLLACGLVCKRWRRSQTLSEFRAPTFSNCPEAGDVLTHPDLVGTCRLHLVPPSPIPHLDLSRRTQSDVRRIERTPEMESERCKGRLGRTLCQHYEEGRPRDEGSRRRREWIDDEGGTRTEMGSGERGGRDGRSRQSRDACVLQGESSTIHLCDFER